MLNMKPHFEWEKSAGGNNYFIKTPTNQPSIHPSDESSTYETLLSCIMYENHMTALSRLYLSAHNRVWQLHAVAQCSTLLLRGVNFALGYIPQFTAFAI